MSRSPFQRFSAAALAGSLLLLAGCGDSSTDPLPPEAADVIVSPGSATLVEAGETAEFTASVQDAQGTEIPGATVTWSSSDDGVATVTQAGVVTAVANGSATITAQSGTASGTAQVTVDIPAPEPAEVVVEPAEVTLTAVGATATLTASVRDAQGGEIEGAEVSWSSSDAGIVAVDENGEVEAVSEGTATITATSGTASGTAQVTVDPDDAAAIRVQPESAILTEAGATAAMEATVFDADSVEIEGASVGWTSSDESVATVDEDGEVTAVGEGTATITAESGSVSASSEVTVDFTATAPMSVAVTPAEVTLAEIGATAELTAVVLDAAEAEIEGAAVLWTSSDPDVATVDEDGVVEAVGEGTAIITARFFQVSGTAEVTVEVDG